MSFAFLPWYTGDYFRDTRHFSPARHGIYLCSLAYCWDTKGPMPLDEQECAGICNCRSADEIESLRYVLSRYFVRMDDGYYNTRMQREIERAENLSEKRSEAGKLGYVAKAKSLAKKNNQAIAKHLPDICLASASTPTPTLRSRSRSKERGNTTCLSNTTDIDSVVGEKTKTETDARATRFAINSLPQDWEEFCKQKRPDLDPRETFAQFADWWRAVPGKGGRKLDWDATWRVWCRNQRIDRNKPQNPEQAERELMQYLDERERQNAKI